MSIPAIFCLKGVGYLHDIYHKDGGIHAKINIIHQFNSGSHTDDIWIDCVVNEMALLQLMIKLDSHLGMKKTVIIQFEIAYAGLDSQASMMMDRLSQLVFFKGKLLRVEQCFINGGSLDELHITQRVILKSISN